MLQVGDFFQLKNRYTDSGSFGLVLDVDAFVGDGWIGYDYIVMTETGAIIRVAGSCIEKIICRL